MAAPEQLVRLDAEPGQPALVVFCVHHDDRHGESLEGVCATLELAQAFAQGQSRETLTWTPSRAPSEGRLGKLFAGTTQQRVAEERYARLGPIYTAQDPDGAEGAVWSIVPEVVMLALPADLESWRRA